VSDQRIPKHDGRSPDALRNAFSGSDDSTGDVLHVGDEVVMIVRGKVSAVAHKENQFGVLRRIQSIAVDHSSIADETTAKRLMREIKRREDEAAGQASLDDDIDAATEQG
jgi:hypothetical protein